MSDRGGDPTRRRGSLSALLANKQKRGRAGSRATLSVPRLWGWHGAVGLTETAQGSQHSDQQAVAASGHPAGPAQCAATRAQSAPHARGPAGAMDYKSQQAQRQRGAGSGAIPRDPARWEAPHGGRSGGRRAASAGGGGADVGQSPACQGGGWPGSGGRRSERSPRLARRPQLGLGSADGAGQLRAPERAVARHSQARGPSRSGAPRSRAATARGPRPRRSQRGAACALMAARPAGA